MNNMLCVRLCDVVCKCGLSSVLYARTICACGEYRWYGNFWLTKCWIDSISEFKLNILSVLVLLLFYIFQPRKLRKVIDESLFHKIVVLKVDVERLSTYFSFATIYYCSIYPSSFLFISFHFFLFIYLFRILSTILCIPFISSCKETQQKLLMILSIVRAKLMKEKCISLTITI